MAAVSGAELQEAWQKIKKMGKLPEPPTPKLPTFTVRTPIKTRLLGIQHYLNALEYNYTGTLYFDVNKNRSFKSIVNTAKDIVSDMLPIQCLEAVFVAGYLTANLADLERFPISFKSECGTSIHRHIILAVRHQLNKWGALGLSRSEKLMYKDLRFNSLSELIHDYCHGFDSVCHKVTKIYIGFPFPHDIHSSEKVEWRVLNVPMSGSDAATEVDAHIDGFAKEALDVLAFKRAKGTIPDSFQIKYPLHTPEKEPGKKSPDRRRLLNGASFEFPTMPDDTDTTMSPPAAVRSGPEEEDTGKMNPILVAPEKLVFKRAFANQTQVLPSNVFLQNTTTSPFKIEVEEPSGQLEIVTKSTHSFKSLDDSVAKATNTSVFRVSAKGMIVIAIKCKPPTKTSEVAPASTAAPRSTESASKRSTELKRTRTPRGTVASSQKTTSKPTLAPEEPPKMIVYFRATRLTREGEDQANELESVETYVSELPFTIAP